MIVIQSLAMQTKRKKIGMSMELCKKIVQYKFLPNVRFQWYSSKELNGYAEWGEMGWYPGGGYILDIPSNNPQAAQEAIDNLWVPSLRFCAKDDWISL